MAIGFYAGLLRDGKRKALLLGPYATKAEAEPHVARAHAAACEIDAWCECDAPGVFELQTQGELPAGVLNRRIGVDG